MRLFIAVRFSPPVMDMLKGVIGELRQQGRGNFTNPENLHLTMAFIGESEDVRGATAAIREAAARDPFDITVGGSGHFGNIYWVGIDKSQELEGLADSLRHAPESPGSAF